jgi:hypothetical protein
VQFDEKWSFVGKKEKHCDPDDPDDVLQGDCWDHVALDPSTAWCSALSSASAARTTLSC